MPVSKTRKTRNKKSTSAERQTQKFKSVNEIKSSIRRFNVLLSGVGFIANAYATITKKIPNYAEPNPDVIKGLNSAIPTLQRMLARRDAITTEADEIRKRPHVNEYAFFGCYNNLQELVVEFQQLFLPEFIHVVEALEKLTDDEVVIGQIGRFKTAVEESKSTELKTEL